MGKIRITFNSPAVWTLVVLGLFSTFGLGQNIEHVKVLPRLPWKDLSVQQRRTMGLKTKFTAAQGKALTEWIDQHTQEVYWLTPEPGQFVFEAEVTGVFVKLSDRRHPGAVLYVRDLWIGIRAGSGGQQQEFPNEGFARRWVEEGEHVVGAQ